MQRFLVPFLLICLSGLYGWSNSELTLMPTNTFWVTIEGGKDDRYDLGDNVELHGVFVGAGEHGDVLVFTFLPDGRLGVRHFYLDDTGPIPLTTDRKPVLLRGIITGRQHYGYGYEVTILSLDEVPLNEVLTIPIKAAIRQAAQDSAYDVSQINLSDISLPQELAYNSGFNIPIDHYRGQNLQFSFWDETGTLVAMLDNSLQLPPFKDSRINRNLEVYYIYDNNQNKVEKIIVTARGEFYE